MTTQGQGVPVSSIGAMIGGMYGGPWGAVIGYGVGAIVDATTNRDDPARPDNKDLKQVAVAEGAPLATAFGTVRVPCVLRYVSPVLRPHQQGGGSGKGGPGGNQALYIYRGDLYYAACVGPIEQIENVRINSKRTFTGTSTIEIDNFAVQAAHRTTSLFPGPTQNGATTWYFISFLEIKSPNGGPDLTQFKAGNTIDITGWTAPYTKNNSLVHNASSLGPALVFSVREDETTGETYVKIQCSASGAGTGTNGLTPPSFPADTHFTEFPDGTGGQTINIHQKFQRHNSATMDPPRLYLGDALQNADPTLVALEDDDTVPAFRHTAGIVLNNIDLSDFGNAPPVVVEATVRVKTNHTLQEVIESVCAGAGLAGEVDASACSAIIVRGYFYLGAQSVQTILEPLLLAYDVLMHDIDGVLTFFPRADAVEIDVPEEDLSTHDIGADAERDVAFGDAKLPDAPREITLTFLDPERRLQTGAVRQRRAASFGNRAEKVSLNVVMTKEEARACANRLLWLSYMNSREVAVQLPPTYIGRVRPGTRIVTTTNGQPVTILVRRVDRGDNYLLRVSGVMEDPRLLDQPTLAYATPT